MTDTTYYKGQVGKEDIRFGDGVFNRRNKLKAWQQYTEVNDSQIPIKDNTTKFLHDIFDGGWDVDVYPRIMIPKTSEDAAMSGHETFVATDGHTFWRDPDGANRNFNPDGVFTRGHRVVLINTANASEAIMFDSTTLAQAVDQNQRAMFEYDGTNWSLINLYKPATTSDIEFSSVFSADHSYNGLVISGTAGQDLVFGESTYLKSDGKRWKADANSSTTMPNTAIVVGAMSADGVGTFLKEGYIRDDSWNWTVGGLIYTSTTVGDFTQTKPSGVGDQVQVVGYAYSADIIYFNPDFAYDPDLIFLHDFSADHSGSGITLTMTAGENLAFGETVYLKSDGKYWKTDADAIATMPCTAITIDGTIAADADGTFLKHGYVRDDSWNWSVGGLIYISTTTGALTQTAPSANSDEIQVVGHAHTADIIYFSMQDLASKTIMDVDTRVFIDGDAIKMEVATAEAFNMSAAGELRLALQPAFHAYMSAHVTNISPGYTTIPCNTEAFDQNADYNTATFQFTAPITGRYQFNVIISLDAIDTGTDYSFYIYASNRTYYLNIPNDLTGDYPDGICFGTLIDMDAADTIYFAIRQIAGVTQTDILASGTTISGYLAC